MTSLSALRQSDALRSRSLFLLEYARMAIDKAKGAAGNRAQWVNRSERK